ncbi:putative branched-chain amino acid transport system substrate-binding protein [Microcystis aeruginosa NIES-87]|uniref:ABC transporter substrate-binding protein n=1 Tax=Microcystis aeruginosa TaxID=1126 RepID=UPI000CB78C89|nr:ABC transporter substrate-binding protein [Microcystis aeruginosa]WNF15658.1 ABC transporter substrate-binding protein [Microcystis aeruginosa NRERC-214]GBE74364.1 putative branched-chain amino acid transport system substrate-binding protein [Microcystis aeruginosa NIES-87]
MTKTGKKASLPPIFYILLGLIGWFLFPQILAIFAPKADNNPRMSYGNHLLIKTNSNTIKESAIAAIAQGNHQEAEQLLQKSLAQHPNDPESVIYLSNLQTGSNPFKIAVVVPATTNPNVAQEILRGVASAQTQINQQGGINGRKLMVIVVNDDNQPQISKEVAGELVKNPDIIAVIGHNAPDASAAPIYEKGGLVMISPTSLANNLSGAGNYIFRLVASNGKITEKLANYIVNTAKVQKIAFCYDSQAPDNISFKDELMANVAKKGGQIVPIVCDLSVPNFKADQALNQAISGGANGLFVVAHVNRLDPVFEVIRSNRQRLPLFSSPTLYNIRTLEDGGKNVQGLTLAAPWHPSVNQTFANLMQEQWRGPVSWRTATSFDATRVIIAGLRENTHRQGLQSLLRSGNFHQTGATGKISFDPNTGDRIGQPVLIQVRSTPSGEQFVPLP